MAFNIAADQDLAHAPEGPQRITHGSPRATSSSAVPPVISWLSLAFPIIAPFTMNKDVVKPELAYRNALVSCCLTWGNSDGAGG